MYWFFRETSTPLFFFNDTATTEIYTLSLHDALPIYPRGTGASAASRARRGARAREARPRGRRGSDPRSEEHTSELQSRQYLVCRLLLEKKNNQYPEDGWTQRPQREIEIAHL